MDRRGDDDSGEVWGEPAETIDWEDLGDDDTEDPGDDVGTI